MSNYEFFNGSVNPIKLFSTLRYKLEFARDNPSYFYPSGIWVFCGCQGAGKTLSLVSCLMRMRKKYPRALICSNLDIKGMSYIPFTDYTQLEMLSNGTDGIIFVIDEIHVLWNSLESKNIPISDMACFCQMRKDRRVILATAQVYGRIAKPIREQLQLIIDCRNYFGCFQINSILDPTTVSENGGKIQCNCLKKKFFFHTPILYNNYDTLHKINRLKRGGKDK